MRTFIAVVALATLCAAGVSAIERRPLPAFSVVSVDGSPVSSTALVQSGKWLLVYMQIGCAQCDALLRTFTVKEQPLLPGRMVIVIGGVDGAGAAKIALAYPELVDAHWYADPTKSMGAAIRMPGAPVAFGLRQNMLEWSIAGLVPDIAGVKAAFISWAGTKGEQGQQ